MSEPPADLEEFPTAAEAAFRLTPEDPNSDALQGMDGFAVLHLDAVAPGRPMTLEEAVPRLREIMVDERAREAMARRAQEVQAKLVAKLGTGATLPTPPGNSASPWR